MPAMQSLGIKCVQGGIYGARARLPEVTMPSSLQLHVPAVLAAAAPPLPRKLWLKPGVWGTSLT